VKQLFPNPDERYASATEAKKALYEILSEMSSEERSYWVVPPAAADEAEKTLQTRTKKGSSKTATSAEKIRKFVKKRNGL